MYKHKQRRETRLQISGATLVLLLSAVIIVMALFDIELSPLQALHTIFGG
jgi:hypothetical protein